MKQPADLLDAEACSAEAALISPTMSVTFLTECDDIGQTLTGLLDQTQAIADLRHTVLDELFDFLRSRRGPAGQRAHLARDDGETPALLATRAASTAAFKANRLVWKAIASITPMMSAILRLDSLITCIATTGVVP